MNPHHKQILLEREVHTVVMKTNAILINVAREEIGHLPIVLNV